MIDVTKMPEFWAFINKLGHGLPEPGEWYHLSLHVLAVEGKDSTVWVDSLDLGKSRD